MAIAGAVVIFLAVMALASSQKPVVCNARDKELSKCLAKSLQALVPMLVKGIPKLGIYPLDPLHIDLLDLSDAPGKTLNVRHKFMDVDLSGLGSAVVKRARVDLKKVELDVITEIKKPVVLTGRYISQGKVLSLPIRGEGRFNITLVNMKPILKLKGHEEKKNGKIYLHIDNVRFPFTIQQLILDFEDLFKGNKEISQNLNRILNENWQPVLEDMQSSFEEAIGAAFKEIGNRAFSKIPYNELLKE